MQNNIFCHICEEELADTIDDLPDKCPICDTRKYEIIQELQSLGEEKSGPDWTEVQNKEVRDISESTSPHAPTVVEEQETRDIVRNDDFHEEDVVIFRENIAPVVEKEQKKPQVIEAPNDVVIHEIKPQKKPSVVEDVVFADTESVADDVIFEENRQEQDVVFAENRQEQDVVFEEPQDVVFEEPRIVEESRSVVEEDLSTQEDVIFEESNHKVAPITSKEVEQEVQQSSKIQKTGASALEVLPQEGKSFPKGNYLVLYNMERKALAYFKLDNAGSIVIGRSSERGSPNDIDITMAWKQYYQKVCKVETEFQDKMRMVKGISRKHGLVRFDKSKNCYVFFHLSDKNYTIVNTDKQEKRERAPGNRNPIYLEPNCLISMGNNKNYIIMRFKAI